MQHHRRTAPQFYQAPQSAESSMASKDYALNGKTRSPLPGFEPSQGGRHIHDRRTKIYHDN